MSRTRRKLPESLELLLDTMCNTFGGIMFIALSLVIISQLVLKNIRQEDPEARDRREIQNVKSRIAKLEDKIQEEKVKVLEETIRKACDTPERKQVIKALLEAEKRNAEIAREVAVERQKFSDEAERLNELKKQESDLKSQISDQARKNAKTEREQEKTLTALQKKIRELEQKLATATPRKMRFSMETPTPLKQYFVLIRDHKIYRNDVPGEVRIKEQGISGQMIPIRGTKLGNDPETELKKLFADVSNETHCIFLWSDENSYSTLLTIRQYFRRNRYQVNWAIHPDFTYHRTNSVRASF